MSATLNELYPWLNYLVFLGAAQFGKGTCFLGLWAQRFLVKSKLKRKRKVKSVNIYIIQSIHLFMQNIGIWTFLSTQFLSMAEISKHSASLRTLLVHHHTCILRLEITRKLTTFFTLHCRYKVLYSSDHLPLTHVHRIHCTFLAP